MTSKPVLDDIDSVINELELGAKSRDKTLREKMTELANNYDNPHRYMSRQVEDRIIRLYDLNHSIMKERINLFKRLKEFSKARG